MLKKNDKKKLIGAGCTKREGEYIITLYKYADEQGKLNLKVKRARQKN